MRTLWPVYECSKETDDGVTRSVNLDVELALAKYS